MEGENSLVIASSGTLKVAPLCTLNGLAVMARHAIVSGHGHRYPPLLYDILVCEPPATDEGGG